MKKKDINKIKKSYNILFDEDINDELIVDIEIFIKEQKKELLIYKKEAQQKIKDNFKTDPFNEFSKYLKTVSIQ